MQIFAFGFICWLWVLHWDYLPFSQASKHFFSNHVCSGLNSHDRVYVCVCMHLSHPAYMTSERTPASELKLCSAAQIISPRRQARAQRSLTKCVLYPVVSAQTAVCWEATHSQTHSWWCLSYHPVFILLHQSWRLDRLTIIQHKWFFTFTWFLFHKLWKK